MSSTLNIALLKEHGVHKASLLIEQQKTAIDSPFAISIHDVPNKPYCSEISRFKKPQEIEFPAVHARIVKEIFLGNEVIPFKDNIVIADHFTKSIHLNTGELLNANKSFVDWITKQYQSINVSNVIEISSPTLVVHNEGGGTWGHFLIQNLPKIILYKKEFPDGKIAIPRAFYGSFWKGNFGEALSLIGVSESDLIKIHKDQTLLLKNAVFIDPLFHNGFIHPQAIELLSQAFDLESYCAEPIKLAIKRTAGQRQILNQEAVDDLLMKFGYIIIENGQLSVQEQIKVWSNATNVVGVLGSDFSNIIFSRKKVRLGLITPNWFGDSFFYNLSASKGHIWNELYCHELIEEKTPLHASTFKVNLTSFKSFLLSMNEPNGSSGFDSSLAHV